MIKYMMLLASSLSDDQILVSAIIFGHFLVALGLSVGTIGAQK